MKTHPNRSRRELLEAEKSLCRALSCCASVEEIHDFLADLCTPAELEAMADRWRVVPLLKTGHPYREIHDLTGVSVTTIGRVARFLDHGNGGYARAYERLNSK